MTTSTSTPKPRRRRTGVRARRRTLNKLEALLTPIMGAGIPALTLGMSYLTGSLLTQQGLTVLTYAAGALVLCVLTVSLTHVAEAISTITGAPSWMAWALAIAVDASLVCSEVTQVTAGIAPAVCYTIIGCVAFVSAALNMFAFKLSQDRRACIR